MKIEELHKKLKEKDKEIKILKQDCRYYQDEYYMIQDEKEHFAGQCYNLQDEIKRLSKNAKLRKKAYNAKYRQFQEKCKQQIYKQVCEKIREFCKENRSLDELGVLTINVDEELLTEDNLFVYLDKIEKGEE